MKVNDSDGLDVFGLFNRIGPDGAFPADIQHELQALAARLNAIYQAEDRDCKGEVTIKIGMSTYKGALAVTGAVTAKLPGSKPLSALIWSDKDGILLQRDPSAPVFNFGELAGKPRKSGEDQ